MEKLQKVYDIFVRDGHISDPAKTPFDKWAASFSDKPERQGELYDFLAEKKYVKQKPKDVWLGEAFGGATPTVVDQKKKTTPEQGVGSPVSQPQSKTASVVTPQSKPSVSPAIRENTPIAQPPVAKVGTAETIAYDEALAQKAAHEKKRSETIASVSMGLERNFGPNKFLKTKIEGILADETKSQDERDVLALEEAYNTYKNAGYKRGGKAIKETSTEQSFGDRLAQKDSPQIVLETDADELLRALGDAEANMRKNDPQAWQRKMNKESDTYYKTRGVKNGDQQAMYSAITRQLTGFAEGGLMEKEAYLRMQAKELGGFMGKMDQRFGANPNDPERSEMLAKKSEMLKQADELRNMRHKEQLATIDALKKRLYDPSITDFELKAGREALRRAEQEERGFFDPTYQIQAATEANKEEIAIANEGENGGKTPQERIQRYFTSLLAEERRLHGRIFGDATNTQAAIEQLSGVIPGGGREWTPDELRYKQVREKIRSLAPIVYLNEADVSREGGVKPALRNFGEIMTGGGVIGADLGLESPQARAGNITEAMIVSGLDPQKAMSTNYKEAIDRNVQGYGLGDPQYWMEQAGMVGGILIQAIPGTMVTRGLGAEALIAKMGKAITSTTKAGKALKILANTSANALKRGVEFEISGQASPNNYEELNFASGLLGGVGESMGKGVLKTGEKLISKLFGDQAQQAYGLIARYGGEKTGLGNAGGFVQGRAAMGIGESFGESTESLVHAWQKSEPGHDFWEGMKEEFGDTFDENVKFFASTFMLGLALGGGNQGGIASGLMDSAREQYAAATPEQQEVMDQVLEDTGSGLEDAHTQAIQESETEWLREQEAEFKEKIDKGNLSVEEGAAAQQSIDAIRKRLSEIESSRAVGLNPTPEDVASVEAEQEGIEPEKKKELTPEAQAAQAELERRAAIDKTMVEQGLGDRVNTAQSQEDRLREERDALIAQQERQELTDNEKKKLADLETVVTGLDQIAAGEQFVSPAAETSMETVEDVNGVASEVPGMSAEEIASITEMMANVNSMGDAFIEEADIEESPTELNTVPDTQEAINQRRGKQQSAPATDESIIDVTGEAPTPIAAEETVVAESPAPQKKGKGGANGGKSKPKANPNRRTKSKPVADLTPTEVVSEAIAVSAEVDENPTTENQEREAQIEERINNQVAPTNEVTTETEVVAESPTPAPKPKKSREKQQALPEGVEAQFTQVSRGGRKTQWKKENGKWFYRNHKPGTSISGNEFDSDWKAAEGKDIARAEQMSEMEPLKRDAINAVQDWLAAWNDFIITRPGLSGTRFAVDPKNPGGKGGATAEDIRKITEATFKAGIAIANLLASQGKYTYDNWRAKMEGVFGDHVKPWLKTAWNQVSHVLPEGSTSADIQTNVAEEQVEEVEETKPKKKKEPVEDSGEKTGTQKLMEKYISKAGEVLAKVIANSPMLKSAYDQKAQYEKALKEVKEAIAANQVGVLMKRLVQPSADWETADIDQFQRMILVDLYRTLTDNATEERNRAAVTGDKAAEKQAQKDVDRFTTNTTTMLNAMSASALGAGRTGAASGMWRFIGGSMDTYAMGVIDKANRAIAKSKKTANGKTLEETSKEIADNLNEKKKEKANEIADSVDGAIGNGVDQSKPKRKSSTIAGKTAAEFAELKRQAKEKYDSIRLGGTMNAILSPNGFAKTAAAAEFGYYALLEGAVTFKDWMASMKKDLSDLTDQELTDIWDSELNGRTLSEESKNVLREKALKSINSALSSSERAVENTDSAKETKKLRDQMAKDLAATIEAGESIDDFKKKYGLTDEQAEDLSESIAKADQAAIDKLAGKKVKGFDPKVYLPKPKTERTKDEKAEAKKKAETRVKVKGVIRDHFANPDGQPLIDKLTEAGLDLEQAQKVEQAVRDNAQVILAQAVAGELDHIQSGESKRKNRDYKPPKKGGKKRTNAEILIDNLVDGNITDRFVQGLVRHKFGMGRTATAEEVTRLRKLGKAVKEAQAGSVFEKMAMKELATLIDSMMPKTMTDDLSALFNGLIMSSVLNSVNTILVNPYSVTDHWLIGSIKPLGDPQQWAALFNALTKKDGGNPALLNPLAKMLTKMMAGHKPALSGMESFASGMITGTTSGKYDESVMDSDPSKMLPALEREQRTAFGRALTSKKWWNPYSHIFGKSIGRILSATDAGMTMAYGDLEFLDALRVAIGKKPNGSIAELKALAGEYLSQKSQLWQDSLQQAQDEAAAMEALTGKHVPDITVEVRAREIVRKKFASDPRVMLDESELASIQKAAQYNTLTLKRQGGFGKAATVLAKLKAGEENWQKVLKVFLWPFTLFTEIPGNFGDALLDNTPVYNILRALEISPTGLAKRAGWTETSAAIGEWGSRERRKQLEQIFFSNILFLAVFALIGMEDDDDRFVTSKEINSDESYQFFGIPYRAFASLAPSFILARVLRDAEKDPKYKTMDAPEAAYMQVTSAMTALSGFYTDQSFMKGIQDFGRLATTLAEFSKGETTTQAAFRAVIRPYLNLAAKPLPQTQGITRFILDCFDPHKYTEEDWSEMFAMTIGMERINNEKKIGLFGEEYLVYPGNNVLNVKSLIDWAAGDHPMKKQYEFLARTKTFIKAPTNPVAKFLDPKSSTGFTFREFTPSEWEKLNKKAGDYFLKDLNTYMNSTGEKLGGKIDVANNKLISQTQTDILKKWSEARSKAKKELFGKTLLSDTEAQKLIDEKFPNND